MAEEIEGTFSFPSSEEESAEQVQPEDNADESQGGESQASAFREEEDQGAAADEEPERSQVRLPELRARLQAITSSNQAASTASSNQAVSMGTYYTTGLEGATQLSEEEASAQMTLYSKGSRPSMDAKTRDRLMNSAITPMSKQFCVQESLTTVVTGDEDQSIASSHVIVLFTRNTHVNDTMRTHLKNFDMMSAVQIPSTIHRDAQGNVEADVKKRYSGKLLDISEEFNSLTMEHIAQFSKDLVLNDKEGEEGVERENQKWLLQFLKGSTSTSVRALIDPVFEGMPPAEQTGAVYYKLVVDVVFAMPEPVMKALQLYILQFGTKGLKGYENENVGLAKIELTAIVKRLSEKGRLQPDTDKEILNGICKVSTAEFRRPFEQLRIQMEHGEFLLGSQTKLLTMEVAERCIEILKHASTIWQGLVIAGKWEPTKRSNKSNAFGLSFNGSNGASNPITCWNCGKEGHRANDCPEPRDEATFAKNRKAFLEGKKGNGGNGGNGGGASKTPNNYSRSKFSKPTDGNAVRSFKGKLHTWCGECGKWNRSHSTASHDEWKATPANQTFCLPANHVYVKKLAANGVAYNGFPGGGATAAKPEPTLPAAGASANQAFNLQSLVAACSKAEANTTNPEVAAVAAIIGKIFQGKD